MSASPRVFDETPCTLGEGPLWHPTRKQLFWFDILERRLYARGDGTDRAAWAFDQIVSAAGWIDDTTLLLASETALFSFDLESGARRDLVPLEPDLPGNRPNDGRADPWGGFWIGTMGKNAEHRAGAIYRFHRGRLRRLFGHLTIPNAICFAPDRSRAYFADTPQRRIMRVDLDAQGWPAAAPEVFVDLHGAYNPDGAVCDADGNLWNAQWGAARVAVYSPKGRFLREVAFDAAHTSCPAFGGPGLADLFCTSALQDIPEDQRVPGDGMTFRAPGLARGLPEYRVIL